VVLLTNQNSAKSFSDKFYFHKLLGGE